MRKPCHDIIYFHTVNGQPFKIKTKGIDIIHLASNIKCCSSRNNMGYKVCYRNIYGSFTNIDGIATQCRSPEDEMIYKEE